MTEEQLQKLLNTQSKERFKQLYLHLKDRVFNTALKFLYNIEDAEEITQDVFVELYQSSEKFDGKSTLSTWVYRITVNKCLDKIRFRKRKKRWAFVQSLFGNEEGTEITSVEFNHPGVLLEQKEHAHYLFSAIEKLAEKQQQAYVLYELEGQNYEQIAQLMQSSKASVESLLFRARKRLKELLSDYYEKNLK